MIDSYIRATYEDAIASAQGLAEDLEIKAARTQAEADYWRDRALTLEAEYEMYKADSEAT